jgi:type III pantothenate kinase
MLLTIDVGNTRTKWAVFNAAGEIQQQAACLNPLLATTDLSATTLGYTRVAISNVAGNSLACLLAEKLRPNALPIHWLKSSAQAAEVINSYVDSASLGSDRWAALIAAWHMKRRPCVVVNAGTAVTIDALSLSSVLNTGVFLGGLILPGLDLMQQSLGLAAAQLPQYNAQIAGSKPVGIFASSTVDAIYAGGMFALVGAITQMTYALQQHSQQTPAIIISGGNAALIYQHLVQASLLNSMIEQTSTVDNLVLQGLYVLDNFIRGVSP